MTIERDFFANLYGYDKTEYENKTKWLDPKEHRKYIEAIDNDWEYIDCDIWTWEFMKKEIKNYEEDWKEITEIFLKTRIIKWDPLFDYLKNWGLVKVIPWDPNQQ